MKLLTLNGKGLISEPFYNPRMAIRGYSDVRDGPSCHVVCLVAVWKQRISIYSRSIVCRLLHLTAAGLLLALTTCVILVIGNVAHIISDLTAASHDAFVSLLVPGVLVVKLVDALGDIHPDAVATAV